LDGGRIVRGWGISGSAFRPLTNVIGGGPWLSFAGPTQIGDCGANWPAAPHAITGRSLPAYGIFYFSMSPNSTGKGYQKPLKALVRVTSMRDFWGLLRMNVPLQAILTCWPGGSER